MVRPAALAGLGRRGFNGADPLWVGMAVFSIGIRGSDRSCFNGADPLWVGMAGCRSSWRRPATRFNGADPLWVGMAQLSPCFKWWLRGFNGADPLWVGMGVGRCIVGTDEFRLQWGRPAMGRNGKTSKWPGRLKFLASMGPTRYGSEWQEGNRLVHEGAGASMGPTRYGSEW